jgi:NAD(P)-dependent dehydrogenase (short-subunit alcohol dehydrogenase family)
VEARLLKQSPSTLRNVIAPKIAAAKNTASPFAISTNIFFSSVSSLVGFSGHANYCATNAALDTYAELVALSGLPALAIQWGAWSGVGE